MGEKSRKGGCCGWILALIVAAAAAAAIVVLVMKKHQGSNSSSDAYSGASAKKYGDALKIAMQFFDVQKCKVPYDILKLVSFLCLLT